MKKYSISKKVTRKIIQYCKGGPWDGERLALCSPFTLPMTIQVGKVNFKGRYVQKHNYLFWVQESQSIMSKS